MLQKSLTTTHINGTNCILWPDATDASTLRDSVVDLMTVSSGVQRIKLALSVSSNQWLNTSGSNLVWTTSGVAFNVFPA